MKYKIIILILSLSVLLLGAWLVKDTLQYESPQAGFERITHAHYARKVRNIDTNSIVFIGSSSIQALDVGAITQRGVNLGIGGETLDGLITRMTDYQLANKVKMFVIAAGFNDLCYTNLSQQQANFDKLLSLLGETPMMISAIQPAISQNLCTDLPDRIAAYNIFLENTCESIKSCSFVDLPQVLFPMIHRVFEPDGIHLNPLGYRLWSAALHNMINASVKS